MKTIHALTALALVFGTSTAFADDCTGILSGAVQGPFKCVVFAGYGFSPGVGAVSFTPATMPTGVQSVTSAFSIAGEPREGEYSYANSSDVACNVNRNDGAVFLAQKKTRAGNATLKITSSTKLFQTPDGTIYTVHGTIEAELPQDKPEGSHGNVKMRVSF